MNGDRTTTAYRVPRGDTGDIVLGWLTRLVVVFAVVGLALFDTLAIVTARMGVEDSAATVARESVRAHRQTGDVQRTYLRAMQVAAAQNPSDVVPPEKFLITPDGAVTVTVERTATTLVVGRVGWIEHWADVQATTTVSNAP